MPQPGRPMSGEWRQTYALARLGMGVRRDRPWNGSLKSMLIHSSVGSDYRLKQKDKVPDMPDQRLSSGGLSEATGSKIATDPLYHRLGLDPAPPAPSAHAAYGP